MRPARSDRHGRGAGGLRRAYATYFDQRFLDRALVMLASLRTREPDADIFAVCHDDVAERGVRLLGAPGVQVVRTDDLLQLEPRAAARDRHHWVNYAAQKPLIPRWAFEARPDLPAVTYVDADTAWFSSPDAVFEEIGDASIALTPHRFPPATDLTGRYGRFNAGFMHFRNDATARRCLEDWTEDCLAWCEPRSEDGRFMNQGYLTGWPERYPGVHVITHPGVNLAKWNIETHALSWEGNALRIDGRPLVMYHFSGLRRDEQGQWRTRGGAPFRTDPGVVRMVYGPYLKAVDDMRRKLTSRGVEFMAPDAIVGV